MANEPFNNESKPVDIARPFHRVGSPTFSTSARPPTGNGQACGCRSPKDYNPLGLTDTIAELLLKGGIGIIPGVGPAVLAANQFIAAQGGPDFLKKLSDLISHEGEGLLFARYLRAIPQWVPVGRQEADFKDEVEIEGFLHRSFQTVRDLPQFQWSHWYKWAFHVNPALGFTHLIGRGNQRTQTEQKKQSEGGDKFGDAETINTQLNSQIDERGSLACILDLGAITKPPGNAAGLSAGVMLHPKWPFWPMMGDYFWARGRLVYDCTHVTDDDTLGPPGLTPSLINPCKAFAFARHDAFKFEDNQFHVPATRFMYLTMRRGGYIDFDKLGGGSEADDPTFIIDLPPGGPIDETQWRIQRTEDDANGPINTLVIRPRLLMDLQFLPYGVPKNLFPDGFKFAEPIAPKIEVLEPKNPKELPQQVKITIPLSKLPADVDGYGVAASFGWFDPDDSAAAKVRKVTVTWGALTNMDVSGDMRFHFYVNGRFFFQSARGVGRGMIPDLAPTVIFVPQDRRVRLGVSGFVRRGFGEFMEKADEPRKLRFGGLIPLGETPQKVIRDGVSVVRILKEGKVIDVPEEVFDALDKIGAAFGERKVVVWNDHVDRQGTTEDEKKENNNIASAIARELFFDPPALFNNQDQPALFVDPILRFFSCSSTVPENFTVDKLPFEVEQNTTCNRLLVMGDSDLLVRQINVDTTLLGLKEPIVARFNAKIKFEEQVAEKKPS